MAKKITLTDRQADRIYGELLTAEHYAEKELPARAQLEARRTRLMFMKKIWPDRYLEHKRLERQEARDRAMARINRSLQKILVRRMLQRENRKTKSAKDKK